MRIKTNDKYVLSALKNEYETIKKEIILSAIFNVVWAQKVSDEIINTKVTNQLNSLKISMARINPKFNEKAKSYEKVENEMLETLKKYENVLKEVCDAEDKEIDDVIFKKVELESKLLMSIIKKEYLNKKEKNTHIAKIKNNIVTGINNVVEKIKTKSKKKEPIDMGLINKMQDCQDVKKEIEEKLEVSEQYKNLEAELTKLEKEIKDLNKKISDMNSVKQDKIFSAMEVGDKAISTDIRKPRTFTKITKFFINRLNTYNVIIKNLINPLNQRIDDYKASELAKVKMENEEFDLKWIKEKISGIQEEIFENDYNTLVLQELGIIEKE